MKFIVTCRPVPAVRMTQNEVKLMRYGEPQNPSLKAKYNRIKRYLEYKDTVAWTAKGAGVNFHKGNLNINISIYTNGKVGDWDNYGKAICDSLNGVAYEDDRQIKRGAVEIHIVPKGEERAEVEITEIAN